MDKNIDLYTVLEIRDALVSLLDREGKPRGQRSRSRPAGVG